MNGSVRRLRIGAAVILALVLAGVGAGCSASQDATEESVVPQISGTEPAATMDLATGDVAESNVKSSPGVAEGVPAADRLIIRTKTMRLEVESTADAVEDLRSLVATHAGIITDLQVATDTDEWLYRYDQYGSTAGDGAALRGWITVRVPVASLDAFVDGAIALGTVKYQAEGTEDVTQQHVDLSARLENLRAEEVRLRTFFDAANNVQEMLAVETELNRVRQEIESLDAQVQYLERQAAMATVTIELTEERAIVRPEGDSWGFSDAVTSGFRGAANVITFGIAILIATAPLWIIALAVFFIARAVIRARRRARASAPAVADVGPADSTPNANG